jgi:hypothetical protein
VKHLSSSSLVVASILLAACSSPPSAPSGSTPAAATSTAPAGEVPKTPKVGPGTAAVGQPAIDFELTDTGGKPFHLADHKGKTVVLEWFNPGCPFVKYAHGEGPLRSMAADEAQRGVVWVSVNSGAPGKQGAGKQASLDGAKEFGMTNPILLDETGAVGKAYGATKTPHMFVIDPAGTLVYAGALDNAPIGEVDGGGEYKNHVANALADIRASRPVAASSTAAYGCSVKYDKA